MINGICSIKLVVQLSKPQPSLTVMSVTSRICTSGAAGPSMTAKSSVWMPRFLVMLFSTSAVHCCSASNFPWLMEWFDNRSHSTWTSRKQQFWRVKNFSHSSRKKNPELLTSKHQNFKTTQTPCLQSLAPCSQNEGWVSWRSAHHQCVAALSTHDIQHRFPVAAWCCMWPQFLNKVPRSFRATSNYFSSLFLEGVFCFFKVIWCNLRPHVRWVPHWCFQQLLRRCQFCCGSVRALFLQAPQAKTLRRLWADTKQVGRVGHRRLMLCIFNGNGKESTARLCCLVRSSCDTDGVFQCRRKQLLELFLDSTQQSIALPEYGKNCSFKRRSKHNRETKHK